MTTAITTDNLPGAVFGLPYQAQLEATSDTPDRIVWELLSGTLPASLRLDPDGTISGSVDFIGQSAEFVVAVHATGAGDHRPFTITAQV